MSTTASAERPRITLHMVASLDGFIAKPDNTVGWLSGAGGTYEPGVALSGEDAAAVLKSIDCYVMGSRTYEHALELGWPYGDTPVAVMSRREWQSARPGVEFHSGSINALLHALAPRFRNVWLVGGSQLAQSFLVLGMVDEIILMIAPVVLGAGIRFFQDPLPESQWQLMDCTAYRDGFVELTYKLRTT